MCCCRMLDADQKLHSKTNECATHGVTEYRKTQFIHDTSVTTCESSSKHTEEVTDHVSTATSTEIGVREKKFETRAEFGERFATRCSSFAEVKC